MGKLNATVKAELIWANYISYLLIMGNVNLSAANKRTQNGSEVQTTEGVMCGLICTSNCRSYMLLPKIFEKKHKNDQVQIHTWVFPVSLIL